jgi:ribosomal protein S18 acetylase RimI-like enzyme
MGIQIRPLVRRDRDGVREMLIASDAFSDEEVRVAMDILDAGIEGGHDGDYPLFAADLDGALCGYACIGQTPLTQTTWHLYWICVHPKAQGQGVGQALQAEIERFLLPRGCERIVVETSGRAGYQRTRRFYDQAGYRVAGRIPDYYKPGDDCLFYYKEIPYGLRPLSRQPFSED